MNENEMLNPTAVETNEAAVAAVPEENVNAAPVSEPQEAKEATEAAPADEGVDEEVNEVPRATRRFNDDDLAIGAFIDDGNDMLHVDMPAALVTWLRCAAALLTTSMVLDASCRARSLAFARFRMAALSLK